MLKPADRLALHPYALASTSSWQALMKSSLPSQKQQMVDARYKCLARLHHNTPAKPDELLALFLATHRLQSTHHSMPPPNWLQVWHPDIKWNISLKLHYVPRLKIESVKGFARLTHLLKIFSVFASSPYCDTQTI